MTANDSDVSDGDILTGSQVVRVYGNNLTAPFVTLTFGDVEYTPLTQGEGYIEFILGDNGTYIIKVDGSPFMSFEVEGIVVPDGLPTLLRACQTDSQSAWVDDQYRHNAISRNNINCLNYSRTVDEVYPNFIFDIFLTNIDENDFTFSNCSMNATRQLTNFRGFNVSVIDAGSVAYISYKDFIVFVFNYTTD